MNNLFFLDIFFISISNVNTVPGFTSEKYHPAIPFLFPLLKDSPISTFWPWHYPKLRHRAFTGPKVSPPIDDWLGNPLLHVQLEPWVPPCVFFEWWFSPRELWGYWLVHIVVPPGGCKPFSSLGTFSRSFIKGSCAPSNGWPWAYTSALVRHCQSLSGDSYISLLSASSCWHLQ